MYFATVSKQLRNYVGFKFFSRTQTDLQRHHNTWEDTTGDPWVCKNTSYTDMKTKLHINTVVHNTITQHERMHLQSTV